MYVHLGPCTLWCRSGVTAIGYGNVQDGTRCTSNESPKNLDVCIQGSCQVSIELTVMLLLKLDKWDLHS